MSEASFLTESFATENRKNIITFCMKLYNASRDVEEIVEECADHAANASSQEEHLPVSASGTWSTAVDVGGFNISGESSWSSQDLGRVDRILWAVGKSLGDNSLLQGLSTVGGGHW